LGLFIARELAEANGGRLDYLPPGGCFRLTCVSTDA
jgi:two-component system sensor histidine kinase PilS (NtrC family)